jgi:hypothetical protein
MTIDTAAATALTPGRSDLIDLNNTYRLRG